VVAHHWHKLLIWSVIGVEVIAACALIANSNQTRNPPLAKPTVQLDVSVEEAFAAGYLSPFTETIICGRQEPTSIVVLAQNDADFTLALNTAGWALADKPGFTSLSEAAYAIWFNKEYLAAPVTPSFWMESPNDFGFQKETIVKSLRQRHHARFWRTGFRAIDGMQIYVGTASFDDGVKWGFTHHIDPNIDKERDLLIRDLLSAGAATQQMIFQLIPPVLGQNFAGDAFFTDGKAVLVSVR